MADTADTLADAGDGAVRPTRRRVSLRTRLTLAVGVVAACFLGAAAWLFGTRATDEVLDGARNDQFVVAASGSSAAAPRSADAVIVYRELQANGLVASFFEIIGAPQVDTGQAVEVFDGAQTLVVEGQPDAQARLVLAAPLVVDAGSALLSGVEPGEIMVNTFDLSGADVTAGSPLEAGGGVAASGTTPVMAAGPAIGCVGAACPEPPRIVSIAGAATAVRLDNVSRSAAEISRSLWIAAAVLTALAIASTWLLSGRVLRPVGSITDRVETISATGTGERVPEPPTRDEIGHLARTMNGMLDRLDAAATARRRFVADASHELRSPLAVIRTETEVALAHPERTDWESVGRSVLDETTRLEGLVTDLLTLAEHDHDDERVAARPSTVVDVEEVVMAEAARSRRVPVDTTRVLAGRVSATPHEVARVVRHLLDNAARHASATVVVEVRDDRESVVIVVDDDGSGVPEHERERIFERFARLEDSRSRDGGGAGLGLAVVASIVGSLDGEVTVGRSDRGGARFTVTLPSAAGDPSGDVIDDAGTAPVA